MSKLYDIYQSPKGGAWGVNVDGQIIRTAELKEDRVVLGTLQPYKLAGEIGRRLRMGYTKVAKPKYLKCSTRPDGTLTGFWSDKHPDLICDGEIILFTTLSIGDDLHAISQKWEEQLENTEARPDDVDKWLDHVRRSSEYIAATDAHPAFALLLADFALGQGRMLMGGAQCPPIKRPCLAPMEWQEWLAHSGQNQFTVQVALEQLGWSMKHILMSAPTPETEQSGDASNWLTAASTAF